MGGFHGRYPVKSSTRGLRIETFTFTTDSSDGTADPSVWDDNNTGLISGITETGTGLFTVTLNQSFKSVAAMAEVRDVDHHVKVTATTASTIAIQFYDNADPYAAEVAGTSEVVQVIAFLMDA